MFEGIPSRRTAIVDEESLEPILEPGMETTLREGMCELPAPRPGTQFNVPVLAALASGRDFNPWPRQCKTRLRWMAQPALIGFCIAALLAAWQMHRLPLETVPPPRTVESMAAPPLLACPQHILPTPTLQELYKLVRPASGPTPALGILVPPGSVPEPAPSGMSMLGGAGIPQAIRVTGRTSSSHYPNAAVTERPSH